MNNYRPEIDECAVLGLSSETWGQKVAAIVVLSDEEKASRETRKGKIWGAMDMRRALRQRLAAHKIPQEMKVLDAIPRNAMGKGKVLGDSPFHLFFFYVYLRFLYSRASYTANTVVVNKKMLAKDIYGE